MSTRWCFDSSGWDDDITVTALCEFLPPTSLLLDVSQFASGLLTVGCQPVDI